jgi:hypothetical protein
VLNTADVLVREAGRTAALPGWPGVGPAPGRARRLDKALADPATWELVDAAVQWTGDGPAWPYAVILGPETVTVRLAGHAATQQLPPEPWHAVDGGWQASRDELAQAGVPEHRARAYTSGGYVALGSRGAEIVFVDLALAPGVLTVDGHRRAATELVSSLMAQIDAAGVHGVGSDLAEAIDGEVARDTDTLTFVVCSDPDAETAARLHGAVRTRPWLRVVVLGDTQGSRWSFEVDADGVVSAAALGLSAAGSGLPQRIPRRPTPSPSAAAQPDPESASDPIPAAVPEKPFSLDDHPGLQPVPPRDPGLGLEAFAASHAHAPKGARK